MHGSSKESDRRSRFGRVVKNAKGEWPMLGFYGCNQVQSHTHAELLALRSGLQFASGA